MNNRAVNISSLVILLSLISFIIEACTYYFVNQHWVSIAITMLLTIGISHFCLESSLNYSYIFLHTSFMMTIHFIFATVIYLIQPNHWIHYDFFMVLLVLMSWITPYVYSYIRNLFDRGPRFDGYNPFFDRMNILFIVYLVFVLIKQYFLTPLVPPYQELPFGAHNFVPMMTTASYIEFARYNSFGLASLLHYIVEMISIGIPIGFFIRIYAAEWPFALRLGTYFVIPVLLEMLQELTDRGWGDIDDVTLSMLGVLIGVLIYYLVNAISQSISHREFNAERNAATNFFNL